MKLRLIFIFFTHRQIYLMVCTAVGVNPFPFPKSITPPAFTLNFSNQYMAWKWKEWIAKRTATS